MKNKYPARPKKYIKGKKTSQTTKPINRAWDLATRLQPVNKERRSG